MPGSVNIIEQRAQPSVSADIDFAMCLIGYATASPLPALTLSALYTSPFALVTDYGEGDVVDAATQALTQTDGNPTPPGLCIFPTPASNAGGFGTIDVSGMVGTAVPEPTSSTPTATIQAYVIITDDGASGAGTAVGTTGIKYKTSEDNGRTLSAEYELLTGTTIAVGHGVTYNLNPSTASQSAIYTKVTLLQTTMTGTGHFVLTTSSTHLAADTTDDTALAAVPAATTDATCVTLFNACKTYLGLHGANLTYHTIADTALATSLAAIPTAVNMADVDLYLDNLIAAYNAHRILTTGTVHGAADSTNTITAYVSVPGTLKTGDVWRQSTTPPYWNVADLYDASVPSAITGALAKIAQSSQEFGIIVITEPVAAADFATIVAGLNYARTTFGKRWYCVIRFRDPTAAETDAAYITAFRTFAAACQDNRVTCVAGSGWLTDLYSGNRYLRSGLAAVLARLQSFVAIAGDQGERIAQDPGWVARGPLENFTIVDDSNNPIGHDENTRTGIEGPVGAVGGGLTFYRPPNSDVLGTYVVDNSPVLYANGSQVLTGADRRVLNGCERVLAAVLWTQIGGADVFDPPDGAGVITLDDDLRDAIASKGAKAISQRYANEFQNALDPNLVYVDPSATISGSKVTMTAGLNIRLYGYTRTINVPVSATR